MMRFDRRRSERLAELIDEADGRRHRRHHRRTDLDAELGPLVCTARRITGAATVVTADVDFRRDLRATLMATARCDAILGTTPGRTTSARALAGKTQVVSQVPARGNGRARAAVLVGVAAGALALSGVSAASGDSLPGDILYQFKRSSEQAQLALAGSDLSRGQLYLEHARGRAEEAGSADARFLAQVLADMNSETRAGVRLLTSAAVHRRDSGVLDHALRFVGLQRKSLAAVPTISDTEMPESLALLDAVEERAVALKGALTRGCAMTTVDDLGPRPKPC